MSSVVGRFVGQMSAPLPEGWFAKESITLLSPDGRANVIASSEPVDPSMDTARYAEVQGALLRKEFPGFDEIAFFEVMVLGGHRGLLRRFDWTPPDGRRVSQIQGYLATGGRGHTLTATCLLGDFRRFELVFRQVLGGMVLLDHGDASVARRAGGAD